MAVIRLLFGSIADKPIVMKLYIPIHQAVFVAMGTITMCLPSVESFEVVLIFAMMMGVCDGIFFLLLGPITVHLVGAENSSQAVGFYFGLIAFPLSAGPSLAGFMYDRYGSYDVAFRVLGVPCIVHLMTLIPFAGKENKIVDFADERHT
ncbi:hypothetical protein V1264_024717 [Littorina saxatilis]|uniref:Uncharacterized protein n=2 Tax=Littorina saxatilis TaxID=31220 RepID=A0AAN9AM25_9CAEN